MSWRTSEYSGVCLVFASALVLRKHIMTDDYNNSDSSRDGQQPDTSAVLALRKKLWSQGYRPVPLYSPNQDKAADGTPIPPNSRGKRPFGRDWGGEARCDPPAATTFPADGRALNTGILGDKLRLVDIDVDDAIKAEQIRLAAVKHFGETPCIRTRANSPRGAMVYRAADGEPPKRSISGEYGKLEILGRGQQLLAYGRHPSGAELQWSTDPRDVSFDALPAVTEEQVTAFLDAVRSIIGAATSGPPQMDLSKNVHQTSSLGLTTDIADVKRLLGNIPNLSAPDWEFFNKVGMATWAATIGSQEGFSAWSAWASQNPCYTKQETESRWENYSRSPPTKAGAGTLSFLGKKKGQPLESGAPSSSLPSKSTTLSPPLDPDMSVLRLGTRPPPKFPLHLLGPGWDRWVFDAAEAAGAAVDYVVGPLLALVSTLIGNSRWARAWLGWEEPPNLWIGSVGLSGAGKSAGQDPVIRDVVPVLERRMLGDYPERLKVWENANELSKAAEAAWKAEVRTSVASGKPPPPRPNIIQDARPEAPRLRQTDVTMEKLAEILALAAPKGVLIYRDELLGWIQGMSSYHGAARPFYIEAYGGRSYRVERKMSPEPIIIPRLAISVLGTTQPSALAKLFNDADDGFLSRFIWMWPDEVVFRRGTTNPNKDWAIGALDKLRQLTLIPDPQNNDEMAPVMVPFTDGAAAILEAFGREMQVGREEAGGLAASTYGKARGLALRLALNLEFLWWCGCSPQTPPPVQVSSEACSAACQLVREYTIPMAERVFGDAAVSEADRNATTLARWIIKERVMEVHVRHLQRNVRLPNLNNAAAIHAAASVLTDAEWLREPATGHFQSRGKMAYEVNPAVFELAAKPGSTRSPLSEAA